MPAPWSSRATSRPNWRRFARETNSWRRSRTSCEPRSRRSWATSTSRSRSPTSPTTSGPTSTSRSATPSDCWGSSPTSSRHRVRRHRRSKHPSTLSDLDARDIVRASAEAMTPRADARAITIDITGLEEAPVSADPMRLRQVVDNLLSNAITYNRDGGTVFLGTTTDGTSSWILVRDTGVGISEADRSRLFQRFYKAGAARRTGTGLGLAIIARHRPRARRRPRAAELAGRRLHIHRQAPGDGRTTRWHRRHPRRDRPVTFDLASVLVMTALVVNVSGILFIVETLLRRDEGAGRVWALAFLAGMLTTLSYIVWVQSPGAWWAVAVGNGGVRGRDGMHVARLPPLQRATDGAALGDRRRCGARGGRRCGRRGSRRRRLGRSTVDVRPAAGIRRRRSRGVPPRRTR